MRCAGACSTRSPRPGLASAEGVGRGSGSPVPGWADPRSPPDFPAAPFLLPAPRTFLLGILLPGTLLPGTLLLRELFSGNSSPRDPNPGCLFRAEAARIGISPSSSSPASRREGRPLRDWLGAGALNRSGDQPVRRSSCGDAAARAPHRRGRAAPEPPRRGRRAGRRSPTGRRASEPNRANRRNR